MIGTDMGTGSGAVGAAGLAGATAGSAAFNVGIFFDDTAPIPTLSQWGLLIMALLVLNLGLFFVRKKEDILI